MDDRHLHAILMALHVLVSGAPTENSQCRKVITTKRKGYNIMINRE
jgi:hypothetical protein